MSGRTLRVVPHVTSTLIAVALLTEAAFADKNFVPSDIPVAQSGWKYRVAAENLPGIDNLAIDKDGSLYATQELGKGAGKVIHIDRGRITTVIPGLDRPDGLLRHGKFLFVMEETLKGRVLEYELPTKKLRTLAVLSNPEGIDIFPNGDLLISEDVRKGRLLRLPRSGERTMEVILDDLNRPEGVLIAPDGAIIFAETASGRVLSYRNGEVNVIVDDLSEPDQVELATDGALWITEDVRNGRLLRLKDGVLETVISGLRQPQGISFGVDGSVWLAEQGRQRILVIRPSNSP
jgi:sugar lactone lactonase YvrE